MEATLRVGIDVGGTFTDLVALDERTGVVIRLKVPSTPRAPEDGVAHALEQLAAGKHGAVAFVSHSSTVATNALLGQINLELPRAALLVTDGFRDVLEIGRQNRSEVYNLFVQRPQPLVPRERRFGVRERMGPHGETIEALAPQAVARALDDVAASGATTVAVAFLHSYADATHERVIGDALRERFPGISVTLSSEIDPEYREYERTSTTVVNALLAPLVGGYLQRLAERARALGIGAPIYVMQSGGGMSALDVVAERPATLIESGPASGVIGAAFLGRLLGLERVLSFDMGGTTAKAGTIVGGLPHVAHEFEAAGRTHSGRAVKGSGYPVRFPFVDLAEVSAGGGTIARVDVSGGLRVGPLSAGADPGPAAYGRGTEATVTDANLVLGRLNQHALLGGAMAIDVSRSRAALDALAGRLGIERDRLAAGIVHIVDAEMAKVVRIVSVERGLDPRDFTLMAFGGGGPLHACAVADELGIPRIAVPRDPGVFSAFGLLTADVRASAVRALAPDANDDEIERAFAEMEIEGARDLARQGVASDGIALVREIDARYLGQSFELSIATRAPFDARERAATLLAFAERHRRTYGYDAPGEPVEFVAARTTAVGAVRKPELAELDARASGDVSLARIERRSVYASETVGRTEVDVFERTRLCAGDRIAGPALIEQYDSCTFVAPGWNASVDRFGTLLLEKLARA